MDVQAWAMRFRTICDCIDVAMTTLEQDEPDIFVATPVGCCVGRNTFIFQAKETSLVMMVTSLAGASKAQL